MATPAAMPRAKDAAPASPAPSAGARLACRAGRAPFGALLAGAGEHRTGDDPAARGATSAAVQPSGTSPRRKVRDGGVNPAALNSTTALDCGCTHSVAIALGTAGPPAAQGAPPASSPAIASSGPASPGGKFRANGSQGSALLQPKAGETGMPLPPDPANLGKAGPDVPAFTAAGAVDAASLPGADRPSGRPAAGEAGKAPGPEALAAQSASGAAVQPARLATAAPLAVSSAPPRPTPWPADPTGPAGLGAEPAPPAATARGSEARATADGSPDGEPRHTGSSRQAWRTDAVAAGAEGRALGHRTPTLDSASQAPGASPLPSWPMFPAQASARVAAPERAVPDPAASGTLAEGVEPVLAPPAAPSAAPAATHRPVQRTAEVDPGGSHPGHPPAGSLNLAPAPSASATEAQASAAADMAPAAAPAGGGLAQPAPSAAAPLVGMGSTASTTPSVPSPATGLPDAPAAIPAGITERALASPSTAQELAAWVEQLAADAPSTARISLRPAELGALTISVEARADVLDARFLVETGSALSAIERALPELRGVLASAGVALGQASVGWHSGDSGSGARGNGGEQAPGRSSDTRAAPAAPAAVGRESMPARMTRRQGLIDVLA